LIKKIDKLGYVKNFLKISNKISLRQYLPKSYFPYGVIYLSKVNLFKKHKSFYQKKVVPYYIERWQNYEIDDIYDFICVEAILKQKLQKKI
jgi:CMP-N-acetylneuraminic acid synthetase